MRLIIATTLALGLSACATYDRSPMDNDRPMSTACTAATYSVFFATGSSDLDGQATSTMNDIASAYKACDLYRIELAGYADSVGDAGNNLALSDKRADAVNASLSVRGVTADRIRIRPYGESAAYSDGNSNPGLRRVDVYLIP